MKDIKIEMMCQRNYWEDVIEHGLDKSMDKSLLYALTNPAGRIAVIQAIEEGRYIIQPPVIQQLPKPDGGIREIFVNTQMDRIVLSIINQIYMNLYGDRIHPACVSYQKGIGVNRIVKDVIHRLQNGYSGVKIDIHHYFDDVNKETLHSILDEFDTGSPIDKVVRDYYTDERAIFKGEEIQRYGGFKQGAAISTFFANMGLRDIDEIFGDRPDTLYVRYSDDVLLISKTVEDDLQIIRELLAKKGLELNEKKTQYIAPDSEFTFLGVKIHGTEVDISDDSVRRFKNEIRKITKMRKGMKTKSRTTQRRAIKKINDYLYLAYMKNPSNFGWAHYFFSLCTTDKTIRELDCFVKDHLKAMYTGKWNAVTNMHKTSNEDLEAMGYVSMKNRYDLFKMNRELFKADILRRH